MNAVLEAAVVVCCFTDERWDDLVAALDSLALQTHQADQIIVVVDHSPVLSARLRHEYPGLCVTDNSSTKGLSGARNTGIRAAHSEIVAFLDDDAVAARDWLERLCEPYQDGNVVAVGGRVESRWDEPRPHWFPPEFDWVVGCTYAGHPDEGPVRNLIGANMSFRRSVFTEFGGFDDRVGRVGNVPAGCEETELCIRIRQRDPDAVVWYSPAARVSHRVRPDRAKFSYFSARCRAEGGSKARVATMVGAGDGLSSERSYALGTLPRAAVHDLRVAVRDRDTGAFARSMVRGAGVALTGFGYLAGRARSKDASFIRTGSPSPFRPALVAWTDLDDPGTIPETTGSDGEPYRRAMLLVRNAGRPCGVIEIDLTERGMVASDLGERIHAAVSEGRIVRSGQGSVDVLTEGWTRPRVTVIVATCDRPDLLRRCLVSILAMDYPNFDVVVVDNTRDSIASQRVVEDFGSRVRWVREPRPGLANAHNRGLAEATGEVVAFTDDDVVVDHDWITRLVAGFEVAPDVVCVTGMIFPLEIETRAQELVEQSIAYNKGYDPQVFRLGGTHERDPLFPYTAGAFGSGANMAFRTRVLRSMGGFDAALGTGTPARGGDDLAAFFDVVAGGHALVYEPAAIVFHAHRREEAALSRQAFGYGAGLTAYLAHVVLERPSRIGDVARRVPAAVRHAFAADSDKNSGRPNDYPKRLVAREFAGMLAGPVLYFRSRHVNPVRSIRSGVPAPETDRVASITAS